MVRITDKTLIIEIDCKGNNPLTTLSDLQSGLLDLLSLITYAYNDAPPSSITNGVYQTHQLMSEMLVSHEQYGILNKALPKQGKTAFNEWGTLKNTKEE